MATMTRPKKLVEMDAIDGYHVQDIESVLSQVKETDSFLIIKNAHLLTAKAFYYLHEFLSSRKSQGLNCLLISDEFDKIFPPVLDYAVLLSRSA